jgi:hypothetical protein
VAPNKLMKVIQSGKTVSEDFWSMSFVTKRVSDGHFV